MNSTIKNWRSSGSFPMWLRAQLHPYRHFLLWTRNLAKWQLKLPLNSKLQWRFCRWVSLLTTADGEEVIWHQKGTSNLFSLDIRETMQAHLYYYGGFQTAVTNILAKCVQPERLFVDGGSNIGLHTIALGNRYKEANLTDQKTMVYAFEPNPFVFSRLQYNLALNHLEKPVSAHQAALSDIAGKFDFYTTPQDDSLSGSLGKANTQRIDEQNTISVLAIALDDFFAEQSGRIRVGLIKLDIEGAELLALRGAVNLLKQDRPRLICEVYPRLMAGCGYHFQEMFEFLNTQEYHIFLIRDDASLRHIPDKSWPENLTVGDILCWPKEEALSSDLAKTIC